MLKKKLKPKRDRNPKKKCGWIHCLNLNQRTGKCILGKCVFNPPKNE